MKRSGRKLEQVHTAVTMGELWRWDLAKPEVRMSWLRNIVS